MRFIRVSVENFRAVRHASIDFTPGLNVLYGPNDLGKSTIARAIRAALLTVPGSSEASTYTSWYTGETPRVELTVVDDEERYWKIKKAFGSGSSSSAELLHSKDGKTFSSDCKGREVEERVRMMLCWGIPAPGGKGAPRGAPDSFLATALLGAQTDVDDILEASLATDLDDSGKLRLTHALAALAQDPLFKRVLEDAQREVDAFFTDTGKRRRGQSSRFKEAGDRINLLTSELEDRNQLMQASEAIEKEVGALRGRHAESLAALNDAQALLDTTQRRFDLTEKRRKIAERVSADNESLGRIDAEIGRAQTLTSELKELEERLSAQKADFDAAALALATTEATVKQADEALRSANSEDVARDRALKQAHLERSIADLKAAFGTAASRKVEIEAAIAVRGEALDAEKATISAMDALAKAVEARDRHATMLAKRETEVEAARAILAYIRWRAAAAAVDEANQAALAARRAEGEATLKDADASKLETQAKSTKADLEKRATTLPSVEHLQVLEELERELERSEAALGGGLTIAVRPSRTLAIKVQADDEAAKDTDVAEERTFEAQRNLRLIIDKVGELDVTAGSVENRRVVDSLRRRWREDVQPALTTAGVETVRDLAKLRNAMVAEQSALRDLDGGAERLRVEAKALRDQAAIHQNCAMAQYTTEQIEARKSSIGTHDLQQIEKHYRDLGEPSEDRSEHLHEELVKSHRKLADEFAVLDEASRMAEFQLGERRKRADELRAGYKEKAAALDNRDVDDLLERSRQEISRIEQSISADQIKLAALATSASSTIESAKQAVSTAQAACREAKDARDRKSLVLEETRAACIHRKGVLHEMQAHIAKLNRASALEAVQASESELKLVPAADIPTTALDVEQAEIRVKAAIAAHDRARSELNVKEGALAHVGGAALREEVERLEQARTAAQTWERELEVDADAWKLLRDTLREAENEEGTNLGRALAGPVTQRFEDLTQNRYSGFRLDAQLRAEGLDATSSNPNGKEVLDALSVGTRGQLAALLRLSIADQMRSAIVLDDHLVHTDAVRLGWFQDALRKTAVNIQVIVITCRSQDYLPMADVPVDGPATADLSAGTVRAIDLARTVTRFGNAD